MMKQIKLKQEDGDDLMVCVLHPFGSGDIIVLVCHVILQGYVIKASYDFMG